MNLSTSAAHLFQEGNVGHRLLETLGLPEETFPTEGTWNQYDTLSLEERTELRQYTVSSPPIEMSKGSLLTPGSSTTQLAAFSKLNAGAVRFSPAHRLWTNEDARALHQRQSFGSALMMVRVYRENVRSFSEPFLCITGPMAAPLQGEVYNTRLAFNLDSGASLPLVHGAVRLPEQLAPTTVSLSGSSREWISNTAPSQLLLHARNHGQFLTTLDSTYLHSSVPILDATDHTWERLQKEKPLLDAGLWSPADTDDSGALCIARQSARDWLRTAVIPPDPRTHPTWASDTPTNPPLTRDATADYKPTLSASFARMQPLDQPIGKSPGFLLAPRFLRFPISALLPVGLVINPKDITSEAFRLLVTALSAPSADGATKWIDNALADAWLRAAATDPDAFAVPMFAHSLIVTVFTDDFPSALSIRLHQEWALLSQLIWDQALATAPGPRAGNLALRFKKYAIALVDANNKATGLTAMSKTWGFVASVYSHPFLFRLRPPSDVSLGDIPGKWHAFSEANEADLPEYIRTIPCSPVELRTNNPPICLPIRSTLEEEPAITLLAPILDDPLPGSLISAVDPLLALSLKRSLASDHYALSPSPAKDKRRRTDSSPPDPAARQLAMAADVTIIDVDSPNPNFDPLALAAVLPARSVQECPWSLPYQLLGQTVLPPRARNESTSWHMLTAIRQSQPLDLPHDRGDHKVVGFEFSRSHMTSSHQPSRDVVSRAAFWLSYRCHSAGDAPYQTITLPLHSFMDDYHFAPGHINPSLLPLLQAAYGKPTNTHVFSNLTNWFTQHCAEAAADTTGAGPDCRIHIGFFTATVVQAIQNFAFKSGQFFTSPDSVITPWHFLRTLPEFQGQSIPRIPADGLLAEQLIDIICNIDFLFHLLSRDYNDFSTVGTGHSAYSRFSPLSGHLLLLVSFLQQRRVQKYWDDSLSASARLAYTKAMFIAISDLFAIYDSWQTPKYSPALTFYAARVGAHTNMVLLSPNINAAGKRKLEAFQQWRDSITLFSLSRLQGDIPQEGIFLRPTPEVFAALPPLAMPTSSVRFASGGTASNTTHTSLPPASRSTTRSTASSRARSPPAAPSSGESSSSMKAGVPILFQRSHDFTKSLGDVVQDVNTTLTPTTQLKVPSFRVPDNRRPQMLCFRFAASNGVGCSRAPGRCTFVHIDLADRARARDHVPREFYRDLMALLTHREVSRFYGPTQAFKDFLGQR